MHTSAERLEYFAVVTLDVQKVGACFYGIEWNMFNPPNQTRDQEG